MRLTVGKGGHRKQNGVGKGALPRADDGGNMRHTLPLAFRAPGLVLTALEKLPVGSLT